MSLRKPNANTFRERPIRRGWVGQASASQPAVNDRFLSLVDGGTQISLGHAARIVQIIHHESQTVYELADRTVITADRGARISWEEA
ncbi:hypothetical protein [Microbacterium sp. K24]|uniref:hypothetical protein n=1 Tax=Microbacterium sp. K24 TaxID=2305446 RepID=UPI00109C6F8F|nr:hypothetical protein [Microbacterium sp. K24]